MRFNSLPFVATFSFMSMTFLTLPSGLAQPAADNVSQGTHQASDLGRVASSKEIAITVQLRPRNEAAFDKAVEALYDPASATYHKWMTEEDLKKYAPAKEQSDAVRKELESHGLKILSAEENGFSIRARGSAANIESAFNTQLHEFQRNGRIFRANVVNARLSGAAGQYVAAVAGLESHQARPLLRRAVNLKTKLPPAPVALSKVEALGGLGSLITDKFLSAPQSFLFKTPGATLPVGLYYGNVYNADPDLTGSYTPAQLQSVYGLPTAYKAGFNGKGQTIVLLEAYGYPTMESDANAFSKLTGLPQFTSSTFKVIYPQGLPVDPNAGVLEGWDFEIALDIDWAHAIAPGAKIVVVAAAGQDSESFLDAITYITKNHIGDTVNDSWEEDLDLLAGPLEEKAYDQVLKVAAAKGISFQFSTGDSGDNGLGSPIGAAGVPSNSPHATAVGGTSILNVVGGSGHKTLGWGSSFVELNSQGVLDPPLALPSFFGGGGGGESVYFPKPSWQAGLSGTGRQTPDVSALADPYTGVPIVVTSSGVQDVYAGIGGTSLASPIFTALWAIAEQHAGHSLGLAAPYLAHLKPGQLVDVLPLSSPTNVTGTVIDSSSSTLYTTPDLFAGQTYGATGFTTAVWDLGQDTDLAISFGLDSSLTVAKGWDNVTGYGTPNVNIFLAAAK